MTSGSVASKFVLPCSPQPSGSKRRSWSYSSGSFVFWERNAHRCRIAQASSAIAASQTFDALVGRGIAHELVPAVRIGRAVDALTGRDVAHLRRVAVGVLQAGHADGPLRIAIGGANRADMRGRAGRDARVRRARHARDADISLIAVGVAFARDAAVQLRIAASLRFGRALAVFHTGD